MDAAAQRRAYPPVHRIGRRNANKSAARPSAAALRWFKAGFNFRPVLP